MHAEIAKTHSTASCAHNHHVAWLYVQRVYLRSLSWIRGHQVQLFSLPYRAGIYCSNAAAVAAAPYTRRTYDRTTLKWQFSFLPFHYYYYLSAKLQDARKIPRFYSIFVVCFICNSASFFPSNCAA